MKDNEWTLLDRQVQGVIRLMLAHNHAFNIVKEITKAGLVASLSNMYEKPFIVNKVFFMLWLFNLQMSEGMTVTDHLNEFNLVTSQLSYVGIKFEDEVRALILLSSLPESWNSTVTVVSSSSKNLKLKYNDV